MILGMGVDLVCLNAFEAQLEDPASRFVEHTFTPAEIAYSHTARSGEPARHLAARFAAKEATLKALDSACAQAGLAERALPLRAVEVLRDPQGRPALELHGDVAALAARLGVDRTWLSLSHDGDKALASVVVERLG